MTKAEQLRAMRESQMSGIRAQPVTVQSLRKAVRKVADEIAAKEPKSKKAKRKSKKR